MYIISFSENHKQYYCIKIYTFRKGFDIEIPKVSCYNATNKLDLKKGDYQIVVEFYLDNLEDFLPTPITDETLERLNLTGDLEEYSEVKVLVGLR